MSADTQRRLFERDQTAPSFPVLQTGELVFAPGTVLNDTYEIKALLGEGGWRRSSPRRIWS